MAEEKQPESASEAPPEGEEQVISLEAEPPGPDDDECYIEPAAPPEGGEAAAGPRLVVAFASGKGGVGKSLLACCTGVYLAQLGKKVVLVDGNLGSANLHTLLGVKDPERSLHSFLCKEVRSIDEVIAETPYRGLGLIPGHSNAAGTANPKPAQKTRLMHQVRALKADFVLVDLPSGSDYNTLDFFLAAHLHVVVTEPEPTAVECAFRLIKSAFLRRVRSLKGLGKMLDDARLAAHFGVPSPLQIAELARERDPKLGEAVRQAMLEFKPRLVLNKTRTRDDLELGPALAVIGRRHLGLPLDYLGYLENEDVVWVTVRKGRPLVVEYPEAKVSKDIERICRRILSLEVKERPECEVLPKPMALQNHYEILGLHPGAVEEEVRRAQRRARRIYGPTSAAIRGIVAAPEVTEMLDRIELAYATLVDPERRHLYDQYVFAGAEGKTALPDTPPGAAAPIQEGLMAEPVAAPLEPRPEMPAIDGDSVFTGSLLRTVRLARGLDLVDIADRTKISKAYLHAIEEEDYSGMPAAVYLRGFIKTLARELKLPADQVARTYMERYHAGAAAARRR